MSPNGRGADLLHRTADQARRHYLQTMIDARLLLLEARSLRIDTTQAVRSTVQDAIDNRVSALYRAREITDAIAIPEGREFAPISTMRAMA